MQDEGKGERARTSYTYYDGLMPNQECQLVESILKTRTVKDSQEIVEIRNEAKRNRKKIFEQLVHWKKQQKSRKLFGKKKNVDVHNIKSCSSERYSLEELRFLCQKYNRLHQDIKLFELSKLRFNRDQLSSNINEEEGILYQNLFRLSSELMQRKTSLINE